MTEYSSSPQIHSAEEFVEGARFELLPEQLLAALPQDGAKDADILRFLDKVTEWLASELGAYEAGSLMAAYLPLLNHSFVRHVPDGVTTAAEWSARAVPGTQLRQTGLLLLELISIYSDPAAQGKFIPTEPVLAQIYEVTRFQFVLSNLYSYAHAGFGRLVIARREGIVLGLDEFTLDSAVWLRDMATHNDDGDASSQSTEYLEWISGERATPPTPWGDIDNAFKELNGLGIRGVLQALGALARRNKPSIYASREGVIRELVGESRLNREEAARALDYLTFRPDPSKVEPFKQRERDGRLLLQPLIPKGEDSFWLIEGLSVLALNVYVKYFAALLTPWPEPAAHERTAVDDLIKAAETARNFEFEEDVTTRLRHSGFASEHGVKKIAGVPFTGDIDVLAGRDLGDRTLVVVVEAKDPIETTSPGQMSSQLRNARSWLEKHDKRVASLSTPTALAALAQRLGLPPRPRVDIVDRVVTRTPCVAGYVSPLSTRITYVGHFVREIERFGSTQQ